MTAVWKVQRIIFDGDIKEKDHKDDVNDKNDDADDGWCSYTFVNATTAAVAVSVKPKKWGSPNVSSSIIKLYYQVDITAAVE